MRTNHLRGVSMMASLFLLFLTEACGGQSSPGRDGARDDAGAAVDAGAPGDAGDAGGGDVGDGSAGIADADCGPGHEPSDGGCRKVSTFLYVAAGHTVSAYVLDPSTGVPAPAATPRVSAGDFATVPTVHPSGKFAYVPNFVDHTISMFTVDPATGSLAPTSPSTVDVGTNPYHVAIDPTGRFAYVADDGASQVFTFGIDPTSGLLTAGAPASLETGNISTWVAIHPSGTSVYVANHGGLFGTTISAYARDAVTGTLSPGEPSVVTSGVGPFMVAVDPAGQFAYATSTDPYDGPQNDPAGQVVAMYRVDATTGALQPNTPAFIEAGHEPWTIAIHPSGNFAYVLNREWFGNEPPTISQFKIDRSTGLLTPNTPAQVAADSAGELWWHIVIEPTGRLAYVSVNGDAKLRLYEIDPVSGALSAATPAWIDTDPGPTYMTVARVPAP